MSILTKKKMLGFIAGGVLLAGAISPFVVQAAAEKCNFRPSPMGHQQMDPDKMAQHLADKFGVSKEEVVTYEKQGVHFQDLSKASLLAKASGKSLKDVMQTKTLDNTWKDVAASLGVTREQIRAIHQDMAAAKLETKLNIPKQTSLDLMQQGYRSRDIAVANELSKDTSKPIGDILGMRKINNTWYDVAQTLGVDEATFKQDMKDLRDAFPDRHRGFQGKGF